MPSGGPEVQIRPVGPADDAQLAEVIRGVLGEFGADRPGFAWQDPELDAMTAAYDGLDRAYLVAVEGGRVLGGGGIGPLSGEPGTCELQKMYLLPSARGLGIGWRLMERLVNTAGALGYQRIYLETLTGMDAACKLYLAWGFRPVSEPLGRTGHGGCDRWFLKTLDV